MQAVAPGGILIVEHNEYSTQSHAKTEETSGDIFGGKFRAQPLTPIFRPRGFKTGRGRVSIHLGCFCSLNLHVAMFETII